MTSSTVTRIVLVRELRLQPAIAELVTSEALTFPIFDAQVLKDAIIERGCGSSVLLMLHPSSQSRTEYVRGIRPIDLTATSRSCLWCAYQMERQAASDSNGGVDQFVCWNCAHRIYLAPVRRVECTLPTIARARISLETDGMYALDHLHHEATLMDECPADSPHAQPWRGIHAELDRHSLRLLGAPFNGAVCYQVP